jgi:hypothetical protein
MSRSKAELESLVRAHGGAIFQSEKARKDIIVIADKGDIFKTLSMRELMGRVGKGHGVEETWDSRHSPATLASGLY